MSNDRPPQGAGTPLREAAACMERGIERYAEGAYDIAQRELEAALATAPGLARAVECLAWIRELTAGRQTLQSGTYATVREVESGGSGLMPLPPGPIGVPVSGTSDEDSARGLAPTYGQLDEVTREWSTMSTGRNLPQLDVPELSEEQIANLLEMDGGRGFTLSKGSVLSPPSEAPSAAVSRATVLQEEEEEETNGSDDQDRTNVRLSDSRSEQVLEFVAEAEDPTPLPTPVLPGIISDDDAPLSMFSTAEAQDQTSDEAPSMATNPFVRQRLAELAGPLLGSLGDDLPSVPVDEAPSVLYSGTVEAALRRGAVREAFDAAEHLAEAPGIRSAEEQALLARVHQAVVGELTVVPRYGKATPNLDSRSAFLLSRMDGSMSADDLLDVSGMPRPEALRVLARLVANGVVIMKK